MTSSVAEFGRCSRDFRITQSDHHAHFMNDWSGVWRRESKQKLNISLKLFLLSFFTQLLHSLCTDECYTMHECFWEATVRKREYTIILICTLHCISPLSMTKGFTPLSVAIWMWSGDILYNPFHFICLVTTLKIFWFQRLKSTALLFFLLSDHCKNVFPLGLRIVGFEILQLC